MLPRLRSQRLCHGCRSDLLRLYEHGFCTSTPVKKSPFPRKRSDVHPRTSSRRFSYARPLYANESTRRENEPVQDGDNHELALEEEMLAIQEKAIAELEAKLGKSLEQAIEDDQLAEIVPEPYSQENFDDDEELDVEEDSFEIETDIVQQLRTSGASPDEVTRSARQIYGAVLPEGALNDAELKIYKRLYGEPEIVADEDIADNAPSNILLDSQGDQVSYELENAAEIQESMEPSEAEQEEDEEEEAELDDTEETESGSSVGHISPGVLDSSIQDIAVTETTPGAILKEGEWEAENQEGPRGADVRAHPLTRLGKFATYPKTVFLPKKTFVEPVEKSMGKFANKHLKEMCENLFGGPGLPYSPLTPRIGRNLPQLPIPLQADQNVMGQMEANAFMTVIVPPAYACILSILVETRKRLGASWLNKLLARPGGPRILDAGSGGAGILAWREVIQAHWETLHTSDSRPPPVPASKGVVLTGSDHLRHRSSRLLDNTTFIPRLPNYIHTRDKPTLEDDRPAQQRKQFDLIIASHSIFPLKEGWERKQHIQNLWSLLSDEGGVLILMEKGVPRGFEAIAGAREFLLDRFIASPEGQPDARQPTLTESELDFKKETGMIVAPCTTHEKCPLYRIPGKSKGRKDYCGFQQRYIRPPTLQRVLGAKDRNHDDADFSYISVMKGDDLRNRHISTWEQVDDPMSAPVHPQPDQLAEDPKHWVDNAAIGFEEFRPGKNPPSSVSELTDTNNADKQEGTVSHPDGEDRPNLPTAHNLPRLIWPPLKSRGHATLDVCTPAGTVERWIVPRSFSHQAYRDARKARWGDLWALGAKTRTPRNINVGIAERELENAGGKIRGPLGKATSKRDRKEIQADMRVEAKELAEEDDLANALDDDGDDFAFNEADDDGDDGGLIDPDTLLPKRLSRDRQPASRKAKSPPVAATAAASRPTRAKPKPKRSSSAKATAAAATAEPIERYGYTDPLLEWGSEFETDNADAGAWNKPSGSGKRGGAFAGRSSSSTKALKREQRNRARVARG